MAFLYVMSNKAMPGLYKIGYTLNIEERLKTAFNSSLPYPFELEYFSYTKDAAYYESLIHRKLADHRVDENREFFKADLETITNCIKEHVPNSYEYRTASEFYDAAKALPPTDRNVINLYMTASQLGSHEASWALFDIYMNRKGAIYKYALLHLRRAIELGSEEQSKAWIAHRMDDITRVTRKTFEGDYFDEVFMLFGYAFTDRFLETIGREEWETCIWNFIKIASDYLDDNQIHCITSVLKMQSKPLQDAFLALLRREVKRLRYSNNITEQQLGSLHWAFLLKIEAELLTEVNETQEAVLLQ
jgi:hypothetical protein